MSSDFLIDAKKQYKVWKRSYKKRNTKHSDKVKEINEIFNLKDTNELATKSVPGFWAGDIDNPKPRFIVVSLNPGRKHKDAHGLSLDEKKSAKENAKGWSTYKKKRSDWFNRPNFQRSMYWKRIYKFIGIGMDCKRPTKKMNGNYVSENVLNLNLFPYASKSATKFGKKRFSVKQLKIIIEHLDLLFGLIEKKQPDYCFFNGKVWETLLIEQKLFSIKGKKDFKKIFSKNDFHVYGLKKDKTGYIVFNRFLIQGVSGEGVNDNDLTKLIPKKIKKWKKSTRS